MQDAAAANIHGARGVAIREFPLAKGFGFADYLLYVDGKAAGVIEAKKVGTTLTGRITSYNVCYTKLLRAANLENRLTTIKALADVIEQESEPKNSIIDSRD